MKIHCLTCDTGKQGKCDTCKYFVIINAIMKEHGGLRDEELKLFLRLLHEISTPSAKQATASRSHASSERESRP